MNNDLHVHVPYARPVELIPQCSTHAISAFRFRGFPHVDCGRRSSRDMHMHLAWSSTRWRRAIRCSAGAHHRLDLLIDIAIPGTCWCECTCMPYMTCMRMYSGTLHTFNARWQKTLPRLASAAGAAPAAPATARCRGGASTDGARGTDDPRTQCLMRVLVLLSTCIMR